MKRSLILNRVLAGLIVLLTSISYAYQLPQRTKRDATKPEQYNCSLSANNPSSITSEATLNLTMGHNTTSHVNSTNGRTKVDCHGDESPAICHSYIHNMYQFYSTVSENLYDNLCVINPFNDGSKLGEYISFHFI